MSKYGECQVIYRELTFECNGIDIDGRLGEECQEKIQVITKHTDFRGIMEVRKALADAGWSLLSGEQEEHLCKSCSEAGNQTRMTKIKMGMKL